MRKYVKAVAALGFGLASLLGVAGSSKAQQNPVTAIDIALEPDDIMIQHAQAANARLLQDFPKGFALDATHHPHISMLQQFVRTADLDEVYAAAGRVLAEEKLESWKRSNIITSRRLRSASPALSSSRRPICCACSRSSSWRLPPSPCRAARG